jgi:kynurenine 3-monooxygenase
VSGREGGGEKVLQLPPIRALSPECRPRTPTPPPLTLQPVADAAHAVVPFFGQGANAAFEDCAVFARCLDDAKGDFAVAVPAFAALRKPAGDALGDLSLENYVEMRHRTATLAYRVQKAVEGVLHAVAPTWWIPRYSMVSFTGIPYDQVLARARRQEAALGYVAGGLVAAVVLAAAWATRRAARGSGPTWLRSIVAAVRRWVGA